MLILPAIIFCIAIIITTLLSIFIISRTKNEDTITITMDELQEIINLAVTETIKRLEKE